MKITDSDMRDSKFSLQKWDIERKYRKVGEAYWIFTLNCPLEMTAESAFGSALFTNSFP